MALQNQIILRIFTYKTEKKTTDRYAAEEISWPYYDALFYLMTTVQTPYLDSVTSATNIF